MRRFIQKYFSSEIPEKEQLYHIFCLLSLLGFGICFYMSMFFMMEPSIRIILFLGIIFSFLLFLQDVSDSKVMKISQLCLYGIHILIYPSYYLLAKGHPASVPIYFVSCLVLTAYLFDGRTRNHAIIFDVFVFGVTVLYIAETRSTLLAEKFVNISQSDYVLIYVSIALNGLNGALIAYYKNRLIHDEIQRNYESTEEARNAGYAKDIFLVNVSHDIRTPLNAIIGTAELAMDKEMNAETMENMNHILNFSKALLSITNNLLDFSKLEEDGLEIKEEIYDTVEFMEEIINMFAVQLLDSGIELYTEIDASIPKKLYGDADKLRRIMINIISNAVKYTNEGYITLRILNASIDELHCRITYEVEDTGIGIKNEEQKAIFEPFVRGVDVKEKTAGFGLGLSNSKVLVEKMHGIIKVDSTYGKGSTFTVAIPQKIHEKEAIASLSKGVFRVAIYEDDAKQAANLQFIFRKLETSYTFIRTEQEFMEVLSKPEITHIFFGQSYYKFVEENVKDEELRRKLVLISKKSAQMQGFGYNFMTLLRPVHVMNVVEVMTGSRNLAKKRADRYSPFKCPQARIMVVDDNQMNLQVASGLLEKLDATVVTVLSGNECLKRLEKEEYDLIFMDYMMPEMDGIDTLKNIKMTGDPRLLAIPVIALTANAVSGSREMFLEAGFDDYISKPIDRKNFYAAVKRFIPQEKIIVE